MQRIAWLYPNAFPIVHPVKRSPSTLCESHASAVGLPNRGRTCPKIELAHLPGRDVRPVNNLTRRVVNPAPGGNCTVTGDTQITNGVGGGRWTAPDHYVVGREAASERWDGTSLTATRPALQGGKRLSSDAEELGLRARARVKALKAQARARAKAGGGGGGAGRAREAESAR